MASALHEAMLMKRHFGLAAITVLTGCIAVGAGGGCSSTESGSDNTTDAGTTTPEGGSSGSSGSSGSDAAADAAPAAPTSACTQADLDAFVSYVDANKTATYTAWKASVANTVCRDCIFGLEGDGLSKPIVGNANGDVAKINVGTCIAKASKDPSCGQAYQTFFDCRVEACKDLTGEALSKCQATAPEGTCKSSSDAVLTTCGAEKLDAAEVACDGKKFVFEGAIRAQCLP